MGLGIGLIIAGVLTIELIGTARLTDSAATPPQPRSPTRPTCALISGYRGWTGRRTARDWTETAPRPRHGPGDRGSQRCGLARNPSRVTVILGALTQATTVRGAMTTELLGLFPPAARVDHDGMLSVGGRRLDALAAEFGTPVMVVAEDAVRQRARDYLAAFRSRWARSDVAFASKAFPCTAIQRVMSEEGLLARRRGRRRDPDRDRRGRRSGPDAVARQRQDRRGNRTGRPPRRRSDRGRQLRRHRPARAHRPPGQRAAVPGAGHPRRRGRHPRGGRDRTRRLEVRSDARGRARRDRPDRPQHRAAAATACTPTSAHSCSTPNNWPPRSRPSRRWAPSTSTTSAAVSASATPTTSIRRRSTTTPRPWSTQARELLPAGARIIVEPGRSMVADRGVHGLPGHHRQARAAHARRGRRRDGRQPRGVAVRAAVRGHARRPARRRRDRHGGRPALRVR